MESTELGIQQRTAIRNPFYNNLQHASQKMHFDRQALAIQQKFQWLSAASTKLETQMKSKLPIASGTPPCSAVPPKMGRGAVSEVSPDTPTRTIIKRSASRAELDEAHNSPGNKMARDGPPSGDDAMALLGFMKTVNSDSRECSPKGSPGRNIVED